MIWVRSCGKIHEFADADSWDFYDRRLFIRDRSVQTGVASSPKTLASFIHWDWVRHADKDTGRCRGGRVMTVGELINVLKTIDQNHCVIMVYDSGYCFSNIDQVWVEKDSCILANEHQPRPANAKEA